MPNFENWSPIVLLCLVGCGGGLLLALGVLFRVGFNIFGDVLGGILGGQRVKLPPPPPRPGFNPINAQSAQPAPPVMSFDEALARQQAVSAQSAYAAQSAGPRPSFGTAPMMAPPSGLPAAPSFPAAPMMTPPSGLPTVPSFPAAPVFPGVQPGVNAPVPRPSLTPGVPYVPSQRPAIGSGLGTFASPNNPFEQRRSLRRANDDRYTIYDDADDAGGGLDLLF